MTRLPPIRVAVTGAPGALTDSILDAALAAGAAATHVRRQDLDHARGSADAAVYVAPTPEEAGVPASDLGAYVGGVLADAAALTELLVGGGRPRSVVFVTPSLGSTRVSGEPPISACIGALTGLSRGLAVAGGEDGVRSNLVRPGIRSEDAGTTYRLPTIPLVRAGSRYATHADIAAAVIFLLSPDAGYITGTEMDVDGGLTEDRHSVLSVLWSEGVVNADGTPLGQVLAGLRADDRGAVDPVSGPLASPS